MGRQAARAFREGHPVVETPRDVAAGHRGFQSFLLIVSQFVECCLDRRAQTELVRRAKSWTTLIKGFLNIEVVKSTTYFLRAFVNCANSDPVPELSSCRSRPLLFILLVAAFALWLGRAQAGRSGSHVLFACSPFRVVGSFRHHALFGDLGGIRSRCCLGLPLGIVASRTERWSRRILLVCDTAQTFPSFVYLIPAIMLFGITDIAVIFSILIFRDGPTDPLHDRGLRTVPPRR